jgi:hypothetical protein
VGPDASTVLVINEAGVRRLERVVTATVAPGGPFREAGGVYQRGHECRPLGHGRCQPRAERAVIRLGVLSGCDRHGRPLGFGGGGIGRRLFGDWVAVAVSGGDAFGGEDVHRVVQDGVGVGGVAGLEL